ncbi:MAG: D-alanine--D-alanine ligase, partial [Rhodobacteraceae bacterium]|nr:D-alanine--D-alanine ligase [Paracoccaceae bacterium]
MHVAVLLGGRSLEREVSLVTGRHCARALEEAGYSTVCIDARDDDLPGQLRKAAPDVVFNALHGRFGEDGCIQGLLETLNLSYTHSGVLASALAMNKVMTKQIYRQHGLPTPGDRTIDTPDEINQCDVSRPCVVKPIDEGSSVGVVLIRETAEQ